MYKANLLDSIMQKRREAFKSKEEPVSLDADTIEDDFLEADEPKEGRKEMLQKILNDLRAKQSK